jgi:hypothetical protein
MLYRSTKIDGQNNSNVKGSIPKSHKSIDGNLEKYGYIIEKQFIGLLLGRGRKKTWQSLKKTYFCPVLNQLILIKHVRRSKESDRHHR